MSDSLRDQLLNAGFQDKNQNKKSQSKNKKGSNKTNKNQSSTHHGKRANSSTQPSGKANAQAHKSQQEAELIAARAQKKALKEQIKQLIETHKVADHSGTVAYSYQTGNRLKQLYVNEDSQQKLANGELIITRLNGNTFLIPPAIGEQIRLLNPDWALFGLETSDASAEDENYADYQVPDDLTW